MGNPDPHLIQDIIDAFDEELRGIVTYDQGDLDFHYLRVDVREDYSREEFHQIFDDIILQGLAKEHFESLFHIGPLESSGFVFRDAIIFQFPFDELSGLVVSLERDAEFEVSSFVTSTLDGISTAISD